MPNPFQVGDIVRRIDVDTVLTHGARESNQASMFPSHYANGGTGVVLAVGHMSVRLSPPNGNRTDYTRWELVRQSTQSKTSGIKRFNKKHNL